MQIKKTKKKTNPPASKSKPIKKVAKRLIKKTKKKTDKRKKSARTDYQFFICLCVALYKTDPQIVVLLQERFNITMTYQNVNRSYRHAKKWRSVISYLRTKYLNNLARIPITRQSHRLALLNEAAKEALTYHLKTISQYGKVEEKKIGLIPAICREVRETLYGKTRADADAPQKHTHFTNINITLKDIEKKSSRDLIDIVLGRTRAGDLTKV